MSNGQNDWGVAFSKIAWFEKSLANHKNVASIERQDDILFVAKRKAQKDTLRILCCDEYTAGIAVVQRGLSEFGGIHIFHIGGSWCGYTEEAKEYCIENQIGLYVTDEVSGALWKDDYWNYHKKDKDGNPTYFYRSA